MSSHGTFESFDGACAIAISPEGQKKFNVDLISPVTIEKENLPGWKGKILRAFASGNRSEIIPLAQEDSIGII